MPAMGDGAEPGGAGDRGASHIIDGLGVPAAAIPRPRPPPDRSTGTGMLNDIKKDAQTRMAKSVESLRHNLTKLRTGRATASLVDHLKVNYYGSEMPLSQVASIAVSDGRTLTITPWEKNMVAAVEKAIFASDLGLTPNTAGTSIRINLPPLTEERRRELTKVVHAEGEDAKVAIRNIRRDANQHVKELLKEKKITEDEERRSEDEIQKLTDKAIKDVDEVVKAKEQELMAV
jgi:ribosome recycling factor